MDTKAYQGTARESGLSQDKAKQEKQSTLEEGDMSGAR